MKKIASILFCIVLLGGCLLTGCNGENSSDNIKKEIDQTGFANFNGTHMVETPEGYYGFKDSLLYFITPDLKKSTIVCGKPDCVHHKEPLQGLMDFYECDAFFGFPRIGYYDNHLYISCDDLGKIEKSDLVYKVSMDGSERSVFYRTEKYIDGFGIYRRNAYVAERSYLGDEVTFTVSKIPMDNPKEVQVLFETNKFPEAGFNRMAFYEDICYFYFFGSNGDSGVRYYGIDLNTGKSEVLYDSPNPSVFLYIDDYGTIIEDDKLVAPVDEDNLGEWASTYYRVKPGSKEKEKLTEKDFPAISEMPMLKNMDDKYIYFASRNSGENCLPKEERKIYVYTYDGKLAAKIPYGFEDNNIVFILSGNDQYMFVQEMSNEVGVGGFQYNYYYVEKSEFNGGEVTLKKML